VGRVSVLAIVPARSGSKGIPRKNLASLGGRPLIAWTIEAAQAARHVDRIVVSTDDEAIAELSVKLGASVPSLRPVELASDATPMWDVVAYALDHEPEPPTEAVVLLQPTSPFRPQGLIDRCVEAKRETNASSIVTVVRVPHHLTPGSLLASREGWLEAASHEPSRSRRQDKPILFARNGPSVVVSDPATVRAGSLYGERSFGVEMSKLDSIDIDSPEDLVMAECLIHR